jgi:hypothetical protein
VKLAHAVSIVLALAAGGIADAHPLQMGYVKLEARARAIELTVELDVGAAAKLLDVAEPALDATTVPARASELAARSYQTQPIAGCAWDPPHAELHWRTIALTDHARCAELHGLHWTLPFVTLVSPTYQLLVSARGFGQERVAIVDRVTPGFELAGGAAPAAAITLLDFVGKGIEHIGAAPSQWHDARGFKLPDGIDHILFLLGLLLGGGTLLRLLGIASGFTVGHTITLGLATFGILRPPSSIIEPLIALTIAFVAVEAYTGRFERHRWKIASAFGLVHGFGFANALVELHLSHRDLAKALFGYNLGVELGQVILVLALAPLVLLAHRSPRWRPIVVRGGSIAIFIAAMYWFFVRAFG